MKILFSLVSFITILSSCSSDFYGTYNTNYSKDERAFFQIKLNADRTVEKTEIHTISDIAKGTFVVTNNQIVCCFDSSVSKFPRDTLTFKIKRNKLYFIRNGVSYKKTYLLKE
jgi:hypothetical protein